MCVLSIANKNESIWPAGTIKTRQIDCRKLNISHRNSYDFIIASEILEHIENPLNLLTEINIETKDEFCEFCGDSCTRSALLQLLSIKSHLLHIF